MIVMQIVPKFSRFSCVLSALGYSHHVLKCILLTVDYILLLCVFMAVFFTLGIVPDHKPSEVADDAKNIKCVSRAILF